MADDNEEDWTLKSESLLKDGVVSSGSIRLALFLFLGLLLYLLSPYTLLSVPKDSTQRQKVVYTY